MGKPAINDEVDVARVPNILERIAVENNEIRNIPRLDHAERVRPEEARRIARCRKQHAMRRATTPARVWRWLKNSLSDASACSYVEGAAVSTNKASLVLSAHPDRARGYWQAVPTRPFPRAGFEGQHKDHFTAPW